MTNLVKIETRDGVSVLSRYHDKELTVKVGFDHSLSEGFEGTVEHLRVAGYPSTLDEIYAEFLDNPYQFGELKSVDGNIAFSYQGKMYMVINNSLHEVVSKLVEKYFIVKD